MQVEASGFRAEHTAMLRMPLLPKTSAAATYVDIGSFDRARTVAYLDELTADKGFAEALAVSSPSLHHALDSVRRKAGEARPKALRKLAVSVTRYALRAAGRPTPFGLLAGVAPVTFADTCQVRLGSSHSKSVLPDGGWLRGLVAGWESDLAVLGKLRVVTNDLVFARAERWVLPAGVEQEDSGTASSTRSGGSGGRTVQEVSVKNTGAVGAILEAAQHPCPVADLLSRLDAAYPTVPATAKGKLLLRLVQQGFLLTELRPPLSAADPLSHVTTVLESIGEPDAAARLTSLSALVDDYREAPVGTGLHRWHTAVEAARALHPGEHPLQVDLRVDAEVVLPREVLRDAERAAHVLQLVAPESVPPAALREYHAAFTERYGTGQAVPLADVLDPHRGLGAPAGYPGSERRLPGADAPGPGEQDREAVLADLALGAIASASPEVVLDDATLDRLGGGRPAPSTGVELCVQLTGTSAEAVGRGDFALVLSPVMGSFSPGSLSGRFSHLVGGTAALGETLRRAAEATPDRDALHADLAFAPRSGRAVNVTRVPRTRDELIAVGCYADRSSPAVRGMRDLALAADRERLYVVDATTGRPLVPEFPCMLLPSMSPVAVRLIREVSTMSHDTWPLWRWGSLTAAPRLPRVRYGRTVLTPARWHLSDPALRDSSLDDAAWADRLAAWRDRWHLPDRVMVGDGDRRLELDLSAALHRTLLRRELDRHSGLTLFETAEDAGRGQGWLNSDGKPFSGELVLSLLPARPAPEPSRTPSFRAATAPPPRHDRHWLYGRLYVATSRHNELLTEQLPLLLAALPSGVDRWFFIRYIDSEPHLRLRFHAEPDVLAGQLTPLMLDWVAQVRRAGMAGGFVLDGYEPEEARYGGREAIAAAEDLFHRDSVAVLEQLRLLETEALDASPQVLAAANYLDLLRRARGDAWTDWCLERPRNDRAHAYFREHRAEALRLLDGDGLRAVLRAAGATAALNALDARDEALDAFPAVRLPRVLASVLHMHHNRLIGTQRASEENTEAVTRALAQIARGRRRFPR
ncbi:lantibiotic dehydratase [Streptomyces physcomitrii]|uniref:Lantibiotic dehydratase n=1 Tax=Streptomyces physcomitrii TaxID=2724184 RepID=A0ABX1H492_9ACTN|nr:lantibiotic dehydratase [Streptomyces physcomitrii]NKI42863.1 lantibiotic dehydratase [Streptomyces physcomitrii]